MGGLGAFALRPDLRSPSRLRDSRSSGATMPENRNENLPYLANRPKQRERRLPGLRRAHQPRDRPHRAQPRPAPEAGGGVRGGLLLPLPLPPRLQGPPGGDAEPVREAAAA